MTFFCNIEVSTYYKSVLYGISLIKIIEAYQEMLNTCINFITVGTYFKDLNKLRKINLKNVDVPC